MRLRIATVGKKGESTMRAPIPGGYPHSFQGSAPAFVKSYLWKPEVFSGFVIGSICTLEFSLFYQLSNSYFKQNPRPEVEDLRYLKLAVCRYTLQVKF